MAKRKATRNPKKQESKVAVPIVPQAPIAAEIVSFSRSAILLVIFLSAFFPCFLMRCYTFYSITFDSYAISGNLLAAIVRGTCSDAIICLVFASPFGFIGFKKRGLWSAFLLSSLAWSVIATGNQEHIKVNFANISFHFLGFGLSKVFLTGSVFVGSVLAKLALCFSATLVFAGYASKNISRTGFAVARIAVVFTLTASMLLIPRMMRFPEWLQSNLFEDNFRQIAHALSGRSAFKEKSASPEIKEAFFTRDLAGTPRLSFPSQPQNVLVVLIEGLSRLHFAEGRFPHLKEISERGLLFSNYIMQQKHTNRGLYTIVCGDHPNLVSKDAKADLIGNFRLRGVCLPRILREKGYETAFMQSANLTFMRKDRFAAGTGFHEVMGDESFTQAHHRTGWGVDDKTLFEEASKKISLYGQQNKPWMLTLLTSGTHHPFNVPQEFLGRSGQPSLKEAQSYADLALKEFVDRLESSGVLKNTLVLITGDEASIDEIRLGSAEHLEMNRSVLVVLEPNRKIEKIESFHVPSDVSLSVADYMGFPEKAGLGRSLFRKYDSTRPLMFANIYTGRVYMQAKDGWITACTVDFSLCRGFDSINGPKVKFQLSDPRPNDLRVMHEMIAFNDLSADDLVDPVVFEERDTNYRGSNLIVGNHKTAVRPGDRLTMTVQISAAERNKELVTVGLQVYVPGVVEGTKTRFFLNEFRAIAPGQVLDFHRSFAATGDEDWFWSNVEVIGSLDAEVSVAHVVLEKETDATSRSPSSERGVVLDSVASKEPLDLLKIPLRSQCLDKAIKELNGVVSASECLVQENLIHFSPVTLPGNSRAIVEFAIEGVTGETSWYTEMRSGGNALSKQTPRQLKAGELMRIQLDSERAPHSRDFDLILGLTAKSPDALFKIRSATLRFE